MTYAPTPVVYEQGIRRDLSDVEYRQWLLAGRFLRDVDTRWGHKGVLPLDWYGIRAAVEHVAEFRRHDVAMRADPSLPEIAIPEDQLPEYVARAWGDA